jgi:hypothetical protein
MYSMAKTVRIVNSATTSQRRVRSDREGRVSTAITTEDSTISA